ncbi:MAG: DoxX family protein [Chitinophagales bacterium]|nr:DoxX family protein [Chitinophagales bacterium]
MFLPSILRLKPQLTVYAAIGLVLVQLLAAIFHLSRGESSAIGVNVLFMALAVFVAWGRAKKAPIAAK